VLAAKDDEGLWRGVRTLGELCPWTREEYRQLVLEVLGATHVFQYRYDGNRLVMLRVFHDRESR